MESVMDQQAKSEIEVCRVCNLLSQTQEVVQLRTVRVLKQRLKVLTRTTRATTNHTRVKRSNFIYLDLEHFQ